MAQRRKSSDDKDDDDEKRKKQPPPPEVDFSSSRRSRNHDDDDDDDRDHPDWWRRWWKHPHNAAEAIYHQLSMTRKTVDELVDQVKEAKVQKQLEMLPVNVSDLMRGFQGAVSRANRAVQSGEEGGEDIERMVIKNLEVSLDAPLINEAHAQDPMIMLPNENSSSREQAKVTLKFSVVSVPRTQK